MRQEPSVVRGERDRLAEQIRELTAQQAGEQPPSEEPPADQVVAAGRPGGGR